MELLTGCNEISLIELTYCEIYAEQVAEKEIETDKKVFYNLLLFYEQWLCIVMSEQYALKYVKSLFMIRLKPIIG
ncbi:MAG: hypothetical protein ACTS77_03095 [Arsenophonus sp. NC-TX2-MAG3]